MPKAFKVLAIDDEPNNLRALEIDLEEENYDVITADSGESGWQLLQENSTNINVILLDRMMPEMDGMEFLRRLKEDEALSQIPVIMQTAAAEKEQVIEGIQAGAYYYLTKPYEKDILKSIVAAAIDDYQRYHNIKEELQHFKNRLHIVKDCNFEIQTLDDAQNLSTFLANFFPEPERVILGISEMMINAIEHGNLGISYDEKGELLKDKAWLDEVNHRLTLTENKDKRVHVRYARTEESISLIIEDDGDGFDCREYLDISAERATHSHGRGIAISRMVCFDTLEYQGKGNIVECKIFNKKIKIH